jgi:hypothetical protein
MRPLQVTASTAVKERRLAALLAGRDPATLGLAEAVERAQILGSLEMAGIAASPEEIRRLLEARRAVPADAPFDLAALARWHSLVTGGPSRFRTAERAGGAPPEFIESRLLILEQWLSAESRRQLKPAQAGALVMARLLEILPFDSGNGRVARLAAAHLMVQAGAQPPILVGADVPHLTQCVAAAFQLDTGPLSALLEEAQARVLDVMIRALE